MNLKDQYGLMRLREGDLEAFEALFHRFHPGMCSYAESLTHKSEVAEEIVQDIFYNLWKNRKEFRLNNSWQSYLYRAVFNNSMMYLRKMKRESALNENWAVNIPSAEPNPADGYDLQEINGVIMKTLEELPERTREIFSMNRFEGMKYKEIAKKLSVSVKTVEANMGKALKALRISLEQYTS